MIQLLQRLDPRTKVIGFFIVGSATVLSTQWLGIATACALPIVTGYLSGIPMRQLVVRTRLVLWFAMVIIATNALTIPGKTLIDVHGIYVSAEGLIRGGILVARVVALLWMAFVLAATTTLADLTDAVEITFHPLGRSARAVSAMLMITLQYVPLLVRNAQHIKMAQISRGADLDSRWLSQIRFAFSASLPLFVSAFRTSSQLSMAMESRGFDLSVARTPYHHLHPGMRDVIAAAVCILILFIILAGAL